MQFLLFFYCSNVCTNAPQRYLVPTLPAVFYTTRSKTALKPLSYALSVYHGFCQGINFSGREADHLLQSGAEIEDE